MMSRRSRAATLGGLVLFNLHTATVASYQTLSSFLLSDIQRVHSKRSQTVSRHQVTNALPSSWNVEQTLSRARFKTGFNLNVWSGTWETTSPELASARVLKITSQDGAKRLGSPKLNLRQPTTDPGSPLAGSFEVRLSLIFKFTLSVAGVLSQVTASMIELCLLALQGACHYYLALGRLRV